MIAVAPPRNAPRRRSASSLTLVLLAVGFAMSALEARYLHREVVGEEAVAWIPTVASAAGVVATLLALARARLAKAVASVLLAIVGLSGVVGLYFHTEFKPSAFAPLVGFGGKPGTDGAEARKAEHDDDDDEHEDEDGDRDDGPSAQTAVGEGEGGGEQEDEAPALAPLSLTGLAALGLLAIAGRSKRLDP
jgi:hypothetical protein